MSEQFYTPGMECAKTIYKMLSIFEKQLDSPDFDLDLISPEALKITELRRNRYLSMLLEAGYITGITIKPLTDGDYFVKPFAPAITIKGIEYLAENSVMRKVLEVIKTGANIIA